jgi:hypothetical protein
MLKVDCTPAKAIAASPLEVITPAALVACTPTVAPDTFKDNVPVALVACTPDKLLLLLYDGITIPTLPVDCTPVTAILALPPDDAAINIGKLAANNCHGFADICAISALDKTRFHTSANSVTAAA